MPEPLTPEEVAVLVHTINEQRAEIARLRSQQSLLDVLREIAIDPSVPPHLRLKAAEAGVTYEQPRLSASVAAVGTLGGIGERLDRAKARLKEADAAKVHLRLVEPPDDAA